MFQCKAHLVMRLIENRISMEFMLQVNQLFLVFHLWNDQNQLAYRYFTTETGLVICVSVYLCVCVFFLLLPVGF